MKGTKRQPEEVIELLRSYAAERFFDENLIEVLKEAASTIEMLNTLLKEEIRGRDE